MDKIKPIIAAVAKHVFWAGCGLILVVSVLTWYMARGSLREDFDANLSEIGSKVQSVNTLKQKSQDRENPPKNDYSHTGMDNLLDGTLQLVLDAWKKQYSYQEGVEEEGKKGIFVWPAELQRDFIDAVKDLKPIELKVKYPTPPNQRLRVDFRMRYRNYVENLLPRLALLVGTNWTPKGGAGRGTESMTMDVGMAGRAPEQDSSLVVWQTQDQSRLLATHFNWQGQQDSAPTTLQVLYAQEDLWVLEALVRIIAKTNENAESRHDAVVKTIESIMIGRGVTGRAGQVAQVGSSSGSGGSMSGGGEGGGYDASGFEDAGGYSPYSEGAGGGGAGAEGMDESASGGTGESTYAGGAGTTGSGSTQLTADPADGRYVDNDYVALRATKIREAMTSGNATDAFLVVAKRMPIRLRLVVDQRKLHRLLAECGNSLLPVEIRQVRINRGQSSSSGSFGGMDGGESSMGGMGGESLGGGLGMGGYGGGMGDPSQGQDNDGGDSLYEGGGYPSGGGGSSSLMPSAEDLRNRVQISSTTSHDVPVELYGIIYIYNPVDQDRLGNEQSEEGGLTGPVQPESGTPG